MSETIFTKVDHTLGSLTDAIEMGMIGLPEIQRPFVWKNAKVRNLFDSMYQGFPVGYLLFWENGAAEDSRAIGVDAKQKVPQQLIVDGQQRLTSLYAVIKGVPVVRENYDAERVEIAFNPLAGKFEVADAAIKRDKSFIPNISTLWAKDANLFEIVDTYMEGLASTREITAEEKKSIQGAFIKLQNLSSFPFTVLSLRANIDEEQVAEVFVRINSEGKQLNQADFILTLMSVFWDEGRAQLEAFCRDARQPTAGQASPFNYLFKPDPDQLLRVSVNVAFRRARLKSVYSVLRGKDLETEQFSPERRHAQFELLKSAQARVLNPQYWHDFLKAIRLAGFRSEQMISSQVAVIFAYALYLIGRTEFHINEFELRRLVAQWFFMTAITGRYSSSPETKQEFDLARLRVVQDGETFKAVLREICRTTLTNDYWAITLPNDLATAAARSPSMFAYFAALNLLEAKALFSNHKVSELMDPAIRAPKSALERHHLFPKAYLATSVPPITDPRETNQIANFTVVEWGDNSQISSKPPAVYVEELRQRFSARDLERMHRLHALPDGWEHLDYHEFLRQRRDLMATVICEAYEKLSATRPREEAHAALPVDTLVEAGEGELIEFKSTLRVNLHTGEKDSRIELAIIRTIAGFLNTTGGTLVVGVSDDGVPVGLAPDGFPNEDRINLYLVDLLKSRIGAPMMLYVHPRFEDYQDERVLVVECQGSKSPVFVKDGNVERFYIRTGAATTELTASQIQQFTKQRFAA
jgi:hypothetical protein